MVVMTVCDNGSEDNGDDSGDKDDGGGDGGCGDDAVDGGGDSDDNDCSNSNIHDQEKTKSKTLTVTLFSLPQSVWNHPGPKRSWVGIVHGVAIPYTWLHKLIEMLALDLTTHILCAW